MSRELGLMAEAPVGFSVAELHHAQQSPLDRASRHRRLLAPAYEALCLTPGHKRLIEAKHTQDAQASSSRIARELFAPEKEPRRPALSRSALDEQLLALP